MLERSSRSRALLNKQHKTTMNDEELLDIFRQRHPTYTAKTLQSVLCVSRALAFMILKNNHLAPPQARLLELYLGLPEHERKRYFP